MYLQQADLFNGFTMPFLQGVMDICIRESHREGDVLFRSGEPAKVFYILIQGEVKLTITGGEQRVYVGNRTGEFFGWSSLLGRYTYTATGECTRPTRLLKIRVDHFHELLGCDPDNGMIFYKNLAQVLGERLIGTYRVISDAVDSNEA